tara:strand:+ start:1548 stop:1700 length:153 start_codon:yes stop_codon:yes gene_type:complete
MIIKFEFTPEQAQLVLLGLGELQAKHSIELILKFKQQCEEQMKAKEEKEL